jgi:superkiller protein 3
MLMGTGISWLLLRKPVRSHRGIIAALILILTCYTYLLMQATRQQVTIWRDSESLWTSVVTMFPFPESDPLVNYNLGNAYMQKGKYDQAIFEFKRTLQLQPNHGRAYNNLGRIYVMQGRLNEAIAAFKQAVDINPGNAKAYNNLGSAYLMQGDVENAIRVIKRSLTINPSNADAHNNLAVAYYSKKEYDLALMHYDEALKHGGKVNPQLSQLLKQLR